MPKCKCGNRMEYWGMGIDLYGNDCFQCSNCELFMKKVPYGKPGKFGYGFFTLASIIFNKKLWIEPSNKNREI